jgi:hypothetical protein
MPGLDASRVAVISAVLFCFLFVAGSLVVPAPPEVTASPDEVRDYFAEHDDPLRGSAFSFVVGLAAFVVFVVTLRRRLGARCSLLADTAYAGGLLLAALTLVFVMGELGLALHGDEMDPATARVLYDVLSFYPPVATAPVGLMAGAVALGALRQKVFPAWLGWASAAYAAYELVEAFTLYGTGGAFAPGDTINSIGTFAFIPWALAVAAALARPAPVRDAPA